MRRPAGSAICRSSAVRAGGHLGVGPAFDLIAVLVAEAPYKTRRLVADALKDICRIVEAAAGEARPDGAFEAGERGRRRPAIGQSRRRAWPEAIPFHAFAEEVGRILCTANSIEALDPSLRRAVRARGRFPGDDAAPKLLILVLNRAEKEWTMPPRAGSMAKARFVVLFGEGFIRATA